MNRIKKNYRVCKQLIQIRFHNLMMFRLGFFGPFFVDGSLFLVQLLVFQAIYSNVDRIGNWSKGEMILYIGTFSLINAINMFIFFFGVIGISNKIRDGELDLYLTKPVSPLLRISLEHINPGSVPLIIMSFFIIGYGIKTAGIEIHYDNTLIYLFYVTLMIILYYDLAVIMRSVSFYVISAARMGQLEESCMDLCMQLPGIAFHGIFKFIFYGILPYGIMATFPVQSLIGEMSIQQGIYGIGIVCLFTIFTAVFWKKGLKRYNSASS